MSKIIGSTAATPIVVKPRTTVFEAKATVQINGGTEKFQPAEIESRISKIVLRDETFGQDHCNVYVYYSDGTVFKKIEHDESGTFVLYLDTSKTVDRIDVANGSCDYRIVEYTYGTLKEISVREYTDTAIQQAILDSWEVGV